MIEITFGFLAAICWGLHDFLVRFIVKKVTIFSALLCTNLFGILFLAGSFFLTEQNFILSKTFILISIIYGLLFLIAITMGAVTNLRLVINLRLVLVSLPSSLLLALVVYQ